MTVRLRVSFAGPLVSVQDGGRKGHMRYGVPASGPMDRVAFAAANVALGNAPDQSGIEVSMGGVILECLEGSISFAIAGGAFNVDCGGRKSSTWHVQTIDVGEKLTIRAGDWGSWTYLAFAGQLMSTSWLGHFATHSMSGFGGGMLASGQVIEIENPEVRTDRMGDIAVPAFAKPDNIARVVIGPQDQHFTTESLVSLFNDQYSLSDGFDRMGVRLNGPKLDLKEALSIPSEPIVRGSVQVSGDGVPTILLADHQTTGGYPKIATIISADTNRVSQQRSGSNLKFKKIEPDAAIILAREYSIMVSDYLTEIAKPKASLDELLLRENLIDGVISGF